MPLLTISCTDSTEVPILTFSFPGASVMLEESHEHGGGGSTERRREFLISTFFGTLALLIGNQCSGANQMRDIFQI